MKSKIFLVILSIVITVSSIAGVTFAWFTDSAVSTANTFTAGTVEIIIERTNESNPGPMFFTTPAEGQSPDGQMGLYPTPEWRPGMTDTRQMLVKNIGLLQVRLYQVGAEITSTHEDGSYSPQLAEAFAEKMDVKIICSSIFPNKLVFEGSLSELLTLQPCDYEPIIPPVTGYISLNYEVTMRTDAGNNLQGIKPVVTFVVGVEQTANNP